jgi:hypothetical protein
MAERRRYSKTQKAEAVGLALVHGVTETERRIGIPKETIQYWTERPEFAHLRTTARDAVADQFWVAIQVGLRAVVSGLDDPDVPLRDKQQALATLYDRHALLTGMATSRTESRDLTGTLSDADIIDALREAERAATAGRTAAPVAVEAEG